MSRTKKLNRKEKRLATQLIREHKPIRTYKRREPGEVKDTAHVTMESFAKRHEYCITLADIHLDIDRARAKGLRYDIDESKIKAVCNHPEDGICSHSHLTDEQLKQVNERLGGHMSAANGNSENLSTESKPIRRRRSKSEKPPVQYYCLKCESPHVEGDELYSKHIANKRGRGRPKKK